MESLYLIVGSSAGGVAMVLLGLVGILGMPFALIWKAFQIKPLTTAIIWALTILSLPLIGCTLFSVLNWRPCRQIFGTGALSMLIGIIIFILRARASSAMGIEVS